MSKVEAIARTMCKADNDYLSKTQCSVCGHGECNQWKLYRKKARAVIRLLKQRGELV